MRDLQKNCRVAVCQASPVMFDKTASTDKAVRLIREAAGNGADLVVIPELFIPGYPLGMNFGFSVGKREEAGRKDWKVYYENSILSDGEEMTRIIDAAKENGVYVSIGYSERDNTSATLYNSNMLISPEGEAKNHRKLKPTGAERNIWGDAYQDYFPVMDTPWGPIGSLICWESYMPLARVALYDKGISIYISPNTNDNEEWQNTIRHIAIEGHCYFINADLFVTKDMYPETAGDKEGIAALPDPAICGGSNVIDPFGHPVTDTVWDKEEILYADLDMEKVYTSKMEHDVCGHYDRKDVLHFTYEDN